MIVLILNSFVLIDYFQKALQLHIQTLWGLLHKTAVPPLVTDIMKAAIDRRFASEAQIRNTVTTSLDQNSGFVQNAQDHVKELLASLPTTGTIQKNIRRIPEDQLLFVFRTVACAGLEQWAPDVIGGDPQSFYNLLHEHIALTTFEQIAGGFGLVQMSANLAIVRDFSLMRKAYRSFVYSYMHGIKKLDMKNPGIVAKNAVMTNVYKRHSEVCDLVCAFGMIY